MGDGRIQRVLVDANILYSRTLRDWLALLYLRGGDGMFQIFWTEDIMAETLYRRRRNNPFLSEEQIGGTRRTVAKTFGIDSAITGYKIDETVPYPDVFDAHVHSAAVHGRVDIVVTGDPAGFVFDGVDDLPYEVYSADDFFQLVDDSAPQLVQRVMEEQLRYWVPRNGKSLPEALRSALAPRFAERIRVYLQAADLRKVFGPGT
ncbi:PIN domain-containing protein [Nocardia sp. NPDC057227]|uniref:PIN domain-containing protein n=1 Tax=Nocardia sp. NPDC057227 TaxID=3346056 RepID=UPI003643B8E2